MLAERMKRMIHTDRVCLVSVRSPIEVASLRELDGFVLLAVEAPPRVRYDRELERRREGAGGTFEDFLALEAQEDSTDPNAQQLSATIALADHTLTNDGALPDLERRVDELLGDLDVR